MVWPAIIGAAASLAGGLLGKRSSEKSLNIQQDMANANIDLQKEFAQHGIRWKVEDAKAAGIHPLAALGAQTQGFSPVSVMSDSGSSVGDSLGRMGQNISESWLRQANEDERTLAKMKLEEQRLRNEALWLANAGTRRELNTMNTTPSGPDPNKGANAWGVPGQSDTSYQDSGFNYKVKEIPFSQSPGVSAGRTPAMDQYAYPNRRPVVAVHPNQNLSEALESAGAIDRAKYNSIQGYQALDNLRSYLAPDHADSKAWRDWLRQNRPATDEGKIMLWNPYLQAWEEYDSYEGDTRLFYPGADEAPFRQRYSIDR